MEPTIYQGERLLIDLQAYKASPPERGDIVLYRHPLKPGQLCLHRIVGFGGESVVLRDHKIVINGSKLTEPWAVKVRHYNGGPLARKGMKPVVVPQGSYYLLGDNASRSQDSRSWGCLPKELVLGRALKIYYPFERSGPVE
jgi:signal peptidase I